MKDVTLELDEFSRNRIIEGPTAMAQQIYILLNMEPGDSPDDPEKGIGMASYRVGWADESGTELRAKIEEQVEKYCDFQISNIEVMFENDQLMVGIQSPSFNDIILFSMGSDNSVLASIIES